jgi:hypothetical protein
MKPKFCCDKLAHHYVTHRTVWAGLGGMWFISLRETTTDPHTLVERICFCPFCGMKLESKE